jgi:hypothetical protein
VDPQGAWINTQEKSVVQSVKIGPQQKAILHVIKRRTAIWHDVSCFQRVDLPRSRYTALLTIDPEERRSKADLPGAENSLKRGAEAAIAHRGREWPLLVECPRDIRTWP